MYAAGLPSCQTSAIEERSRRRIGAFKQDETKDNHMNKMTRKLPRGG